MTDWGRGGFTGSLQRWVKREVHEQLTGNPVALGARYSWSRRSLQFIFAAGSFGRFIALYFALDVGLVAFEALWSSFFRDGLFPWASSAAAVELVQTVPGYLIGAQVGILGVISLALALVTLIAQRDEAATDVQVYYHESLFFEITASFLALVAVLGAQLLWPLQSVLHLLTKSGSEAGLFKFGILGLHLAWFLVNLTGVAHFIRVTFRFVQRGARAAMRESYTANIIVPRDLTSSVTRAMYANAAAEALPAEKESIQTVLCGFSASETYASEISAHFKHPVRLKDLHVRLAYWAIRRWKKRCDAAVMNTAPVVTARTLASQIEPSLSFLPRIGDPMRGEIDWCRRRGGLPLDALEKLALRLAFRFERSSDVD